MFFHHKTNHCPLPRNFFFHFYIFVKKIFSRFLSPVLMSSPVLSILDISYCSLTHRLFNTGCIEFTQAISGKLLKGNEWLNIFLTVSVKPVSDYDPGWRSYPSFSLGKLIIFLCGFSFKRFCLFLRQKERGKFQKMFTFWDRNTTITSSVLVIKINKW